MVRLLSRYWWVLVARGLIAVLFGILAVSLPVTTTGALVLVFGAFSAVDGVFAFFSGFSSIGKSSSWWVMVLHGLVGIGVGGLTLIRPDITAMALLIYIAIWAILIGGLQVFASIRLRREISGEFWLGLGGLLGILFGVSVLLRPAEGALAVVWMIGVFAIAYGITLLVSGIKVHRLARAAA